MGNIRRTAYAFFTLEDEYVLDPVALLRGVVPLPAGQGRVVALAVLTGQQHSLKPAEWQALRALPTDRWTPDDGFDSELVRSLVEKGLIIADAGDAVSGELRERDEALTDNAWNPYAALYHFSTQWSGVTIGDPGEPDGELAATTRAAIAALVAEHGPPPGELAHVDSARALSLPNRRRDEPFYQTLVQRRTTRAFDLDQPMALADLDTVLRYVFGCHGYASRVEDVVCIKRTSASGGGLHPITAYPVVTNVENLEPGVYHFNARDHSLSPLLSLRTGEARDLADAFMCGQRYFADAHVSFVLAARFYRNHWKYRRHPRAYAGILMDAAHLSQTLYLLSTELGLGAFVTIGINGRDIERRLGLDGVGEGVIAMCGCGRKAAAPSPLEPDFTPWPSEEPT